MNRELTTDVVQEYMGSESSESEAAAMIEALAGEGITYETGVRNCDDATWQQLMVRAIERAGNNNDIKEA